MALYEKYRKDSDKQICKLYLSIHHKTILIQMLALRNSCYTKDIERILIKNGIVQGLTPEEAKSLKLIQIK